MSKEQKDDDARCNTCDREFGGSVCYQRLEDEANLATMEQGEIVQQCCEDCAAVAAEEYRAERLGWNWRDLDGAEKEVYEGNRSGWCPIQAKQEAYKDYIKGAKGRINMAGRRAYLAAFREESKNHWHNVLDDDERNNYILAVDTDADKPLQEQLNYVQDVAYVVAKRRAGKR